MDIDEKLQRAIAVVKADVEPHACVLKFLTREFGRGNASLLIRDAHGGVSRLYKAHRAMKLAIKRWNGSHRDTEQIMRAATVYMERRDEVASLCSAPPIHPTMQMKMMERRKERASFYRSGQR